MTTETFTDPAAFAAAVRKAQRAASKARRPAERPPMPRAVAGDGDRPEQLARIAVYGYGPRWDNGLFTFWNPRTNARTTAHARYAAACIAAEREVRG